MTTKKLVDRVRGTISNKGTKRIYVKFQYLKQTIEYATGDFDTPENRKHWEKWLNKAIEKIDEGSFVYGDVFPGAKPEKKALFAKLEGRELKIDPSSVTFDEVIVKYLADKVENFASESLKVSYKSKIKCRIRPYFKDMTFSEFNSSEVAKFIGYLAGNQERRK
jgi:hypothetical protein